MTINDDAEPGRPNHPGDVRKGSREKILCDIQRSVCVCVFVLKIAPFFGALIG